jgi:serine/threonine protein kinase
MLSPHQITSFENTTGTSSRGTFTIGKEIARGSFINVFAAKWGDQECVCKITPVTNGRSELENDIIWLRTISRSSSMMVPEPIMMIELETHHLLFQQRLDRSLADLHACSPSWFTKDVCKKICHDMLLILHRFHRCGVVYGDLKVENIMIGYGDTKDTLRVVDMGGVAYIGRPVLNHGTLLTCSLANHYGNRLTIASELESLAYVIADLYQGLPWDNDNGCPDGLPDREADAYMRNAVKKAKETETLFGDFPEMRHFLNAAKAGYEDWEMYRDLVKTGVQAYPWSGKELPPLEIKSPSPFPLNTSPGASRVY